MMCGICVWSVWTQACLGGTSESTSDTVCVRAFVCACVVTGGKHGRERGEGKGAALADP